MKRLTALILLVLMFAMMCACNSDPYSSVKSKIESGDYEGAVQEIESNYKLSDDEGRKYKRYAEGMIELKEGNVTGAHEKLSQLAGFMNASDTLLEIERFYSAIEGTYTTEKLDTELVIEIRDDGTVTVGISDQITYDYAVFTDSLSTSGTLNFSMGFTYHDDVEYDLTLDSSGETLFVATAEHSDHNVFDGTYTKK